MAKLHQRIFALVGAVLFLGTSMALTIAVLWQAHTNSSKLTKAQSAAADQQQGANKLEGTKLSGFTPVTSVKKLEIIDLTVGTGAEAKAGGTVTAHYTGALAKDGTIFQSSYDSGAPVQFSLSGVIKGWSEGVPGMKVGGKRRLVIPAALAYGTSSPGPSIPANSDLVFDIDLTAVK